MARTPNDARTGLAPGDAQPVVEPLAPAQILAVIQRGCQSDLRQTAVQFTASVELHDKLERLRALMRSSVPDGDLAAIIEQAVTEKLERLEAKRFAKTKARRKSVEHADTSPSSRYIPAPVKRAVRERDGDQCAFIDAEARRCREREGLEFHHKQPFARGGDHRPENLKLICPAHNRYLAERDYGKEVMGRYQRSSICAREPAPVYTSR